MTAVAPTRTEIDARRHLTRIRETVRQFKGEAWARNAERETQAPSAKVVYFIQAGIDGPIKVGVASDVAARVASLQVGCPFPLALLGTVPGGFSAERRLHSMFSEFRMQGEWFEPDWSVLNYIKAAIA